NPIGSLLLDIFVVFTLEQADRLFSRALAEGLGRFGDHSWAEMLNGKAITGTWLAQQLRPYGIRPKTLWIGDTSAKGYTFEDLQEVFQRYIPRCEVEALSAELRPPQPTTEPDAARREGPPEGR